MAAAIHTVGPLHVGDHEVRIRTNDAEFAVAAGRAFRDLHVDPSRAAAGPPVVFDTLRHEQPVPHWSVRRDGLACELDLLDDAVLVHQQWELNRLAIESRPAAIHAAAVVGEGGAVVLAGRSHSGKTTLAGWLAAQHAFGYLADEVVALDEQLRASPFHRPLGVRADSPLAALASRADEQRPAIESLVPASTLGAALHRSAASVRLIVFPRFVADGAPTMAPVDQADALERLAALTPGLARDGTPVFEQLAGLVATAPAIEVTHGDVRDAAALVVAAIAATPPGGARR